MMNLKNITFIKWNYQTYVVNNRNQFWFLSTSCIICGYDSPHWNVNDTKDLCLRLDGYDWL